MARFFFDHSTTDETIIDQDGVDVANLDELKRLALDALGQLMVEGAPHGLTGRMSVTVRDGSGPVLSASAVIVLQTG